MPITKKKDWEKHVYANQDPYGSCAIKVARKVMELLDDEKHKEFNAGDIIIEADRFFDAGITGFMAGCIAGIVSNVHSRGEEFRKKWNIENQIGKEGESANEDKGILNPALLEIKSKEE